MDLRCSADPAAGGACGQGRVHGGRHSMHGATTQDAVGLAVKVESRAAGMRGATIEGARGAAGLAVKVKTMLGIGTRASTRIPKWITKWRRGTKGQRSRGWQRVKEFIKEVNGKHFKFQKTTMICN